jgi:hypothetical protein
LSIAADRADWLARRRGQAPGLDGFDAEAAQAFAARAGEGWLDDAACAELLALAGITVADAAAGTEVLVGAINDAELGPVVGVGTGGGRALVAGDVGFRLAPLMDVDAEDLVRTPAAVRAELAADVHDVAALRDVILRLGALADAVPELAEAELDPVRVAEDGATVTAARIRLAPPTARDRPKTW